MKDIPVRKDFGARLKQLRKQHGMTQKELCEKLDVQFSILNKYESGIHAPPIEKLIDLAEIFNTTIDFLLTGNQTDEKPLQNKRLLERFRELENFDINEQETIVKLIDAFIVQHKVKGAINPFEHQNG